MKKTSFIGVLIALLFLCFVATPSAHALEKYFYTDATSHGFNRQIYTRETNKLNPNNPPPGKTFQDLMNDYDTLLFYVSVQGNVNRSKPTYTVVVDPIDTKWLDKLPQENIWLQNSARQPLNDTAQVLQEFSKSNYGIKGSVVWTEDKPYTQDIAETVAGAEDLVIVRRGSALFNQITSVFPVRVDLSNDGIAAQFNSKRQGYQWAIDNYLKTGKVKPIIAYQKDGYLLKLYKQGKMFLDPAYDATFSGWGIMAHDVMMANRTFFLDVSPRVETQPQDELNQPIGEDKGTMDLAIAAAREKVGNTALLEFWGYPNEKYYKCEYGWSGVFCGEWAFAEVVSRAGGMKRFGGGEQWGYETSNFSFYQHGPGVDMVSQPKPMNQHELLQKGYASGYPDNFSFEEGTNRWNVSFLTNSVVYNSGNGASYSPTHGNNYLEVNINQVDHDNSQKTHSFFQDIGINLMRGYRYKYSIKTRSPSSVDLKGKQVVWGFKPGGSDILCESPLNISSPQWQEFSCPFDVKQDGYTSVRFEIYLDSVDKNYDFDEAYFDGPNTTHVNPNKKFTYMYMGDMDMANGLYTYPMITDFGTEVGRDVGLPLEDNMVNNFPLAWGVASNFAREVPPLYAYRAKKKTGTDWFVMPDSGAGYANPAKFRPESIPAWVQDSANENRKYGYRSGWVLEGFNSENVYCFNGTANWDTQTLPCDISKGQSVRNMYKTISPEGILFNGLLVPSFLDERLGGVQLGSYAWGGLSVPMAVGLPLWPKVPAGEQFLALRNVYIPPRIVRDAFNQSKAQQDPNIEAVDPNTFFYLLKASKGQDTSNRSSLVSHTIPGIMVKGQSYQVSVTVRNDGWDTWVPTNQDCGGYTPASKGCHIFAAGIFPGHIDPQTIPGYNIWQGLPDVVEPGQNVTLNFTITAPTDKGSYTFQTDMVKDQINAFQAYGNQPWQKTIKVLDAPLDRNSDGKVNYEDVEPLLDAYGQTDPTKDVNGDGKVNAMDIGLITNNAEVPRAQ